MSRAPAFGSPLGAGERPGLLIVDLTTGFTDATSPLACQLDSTVAAVAHLLAASRRGGAPVAYSRVAFGADITAGGALFREKVPGLRTLDEGGAWAEIDPRLAPRDGETVLTKQGASAFWGTDLARWAARRRLDTLVVTGASTSGCVRATVVDALQHGLRPIVPAEAVGDRDRTSHEVSLLDIDGRYGDVVTLETACAVLLGGRTAARHEDEEAREGNGEPE